MLKIIPTPTEEVLCALPGERWGNILKGYVNGIYFEYYEDDVINFKFFYALGKVLILKNSFSSNFSVSELETFFDKCVDLGDLYKWLDQVPFEILNTKNKNDGEIKQIWKMDQEVSLPEGVYDSVLARRYCEIKISTVKIRSIPYYSWTATSTKVKFEIQDETNKTYWSTLCLLKYQKLLGRL